MGGKPSGRAQVREIFMFSPNEEWLLGPAIVATPEEPEQLPKVYCFWCCNFFPLEISGEKSLGWSLCIVGWRWDSMAPMPESEGSTSTINWQVGSGCCKTVMLVNNPLNLCNASTPGDQSNGEVAEDSWEVLWLSCSHEWTFCRY